MPPPEIKNLQNIWNLCPDLDDLSVLECANVNDVVLIVLRVKVT